MKHRRIDFRGFTRGMEAETQCIQRESHGGSTVPKAEAKRERERDDPLDVIDATSPMTEPSLRGQYARCRDCELIVRVNNIDSYRLRSEPHQTLCI